jgi:hypothetical protein
MARTLSAASLLKREELASSASDPVAVSHLRTLIEDGDDIACFTVNAFRVGAEIGVSRPAALRALLFAARLGLFDLNWDVRCPSCTGTPDFHRHLMQLQRSAHCGLCDLNWEIEFDEQVEVTFTVNPDVRKLDVRDFRDLVFPEILTYFNTINGREQRLPHARAMREPNANATSYPPTDRSMFAPSLSRQAPRS